MSNSDLPVDHASLVLPEYASEDEMDEEMTTIFWEWDGPEDPTPARGGGT